jgi:hypothetical protein
MVSIVLHRAAPRNKSVRPVYGAGMAVRPMGRDRRLAIGALLRQK